MDAQKDQPHELPNKAEHQSLFRVDDVRTLDAYHVQPVLLGKVHCVVSVLHSLKPRQGALIRRNPNIGSFIFVSPARVRGHASTFLRFRDTSPDDAPRKDLVKRLENDQAISQVLEKIEHARFHTEGVEPQSEYASLAFSFRIEILNLPIILGFLFIQRLETWMGVEEVGDKRQVQAWISSDKR